MRESVRAAVLAGALCLGMALVGASSAAAPKSHHPHRAKPAPAVEPASEQTVVSVEPASEQAPVAAEAASEQTSVSADPVSDQPPARTERERDQTDASKETAKDLPSAGSEPVSNQAEVGAEPASDQPPARTERELDQTDASTEPAKVLPSAGSEPVAKQADIGAEPASGWPAARAEREPGPDQTDVSTEPAADQPSAGSEPVSNQTDVGAEKPTDEAEGPAPVSEEVTRFQSWVVASGDNQGLPFAIVDKVQAEVLVFDPDGQLRGAAPALIGMARGDDSEPGIGERKLSTIRPEERTTPAGRFISGFGQVPGEETILWVDYEDAISIHPVITSNRKEHRLQRLKSPTPDDNRITFGCINVPAGFYEDVVRRTFTGTKGVFYILPEMKPVEDVFPAFRPQDATQTAAATPPSAGGEGPIPTGPAEPNR
jgi:hypothetical protein